MSQKERKQKYDLLCRYIKSKLIMWGYDKQEFADMIHVSVTSVYNKLNNPDTFTLPELQTIFHNLKFTPDEILQVI